MTDKYILTENLKKKDKRKGMTVVMVPRPHLEKATAQLERLTVNLFVQLSGNSGTNNSELYGIWASLPRNCYLGLLRLYTLWRDCKEFLQF